MDPRVQFGREAEKYLTSAVHSDPNSLLALRELVQPEGGWILDIATGAGHLALAFAPFVHGVLASDPTPEMLKVCRDEAQRKGITNLYAVQHCAENLPYSESSFQGVGCRVAAHHFNNQIAFIKEVFRVLKSGGWFLFVDTVGSDAHDARQCIDEFETIRDPSHKTNRPISEWRKLILDSGFSISHDSSQRKTLQTQDWMDRMSVSAEDQNRLRKILTEARGEFADYLNASAETFDLLEWVCLAHKP